MKWVDRNYQEGQGHTEGPWMLADDNGSALQYLDYKRGKWVIYAGELANREFDDLEEAKAVALVDHKLET